MHDSGKEFTNTINEYIVPISIPKQNIITSMVHIAWVVDDTSKGSKLKEKEQQQYLLTPPHKAHDSHEIGK